MNEASRLAYAEGQMAFEEFKEYYENPYPSGSSLYYDWEAGWNSAYYSNETY